MSNPIEGRDLVADGFIPRVPVTAQMLLSPADYRQCVAQNTAERLVLRGYGHYRFEVLPQGWNEDARFFIGVNLKEEGGLWVGMVWITKNAELGYNDDMQPHQWRIEHGAAWLTAKLAVDRWLAKKRDDFPTQAELFPDTKPRSPE